ncbi:MAG: hypothetical protein LDL16_08910 [Thiobacillus sp.]|nr:hypothetical protein [Thiobacillus sp.]
MSVSLTPSPFGVFHGSTGRMTMFSLTLLFVELRVLRLLPRPGSPSAPLWEKDKRSASRILAD